MPAERGTPDGSASGEPSVSAGTDPTSAPKSKAGRNLPAAIAVGLGLGVSLILILSYIPLIWIGVVSVAMVVATWEVAKRLREADIRVPRIPLIAGGQAVLWLGWPFGVQGVLAAFAGTVLVCMVWRLFDHGLTATPRNFLPDTAVTVFVAAWIPLLASFGVLMVLQDDGPGRVLCLMIGVVCSDVGGYAAGSMFGKHPMVPRVSPKKSWEGFFGSLLFCVIGSIATVTLILEENPLIGLALGTVLVVVATLGDLIESQIKRELGIKDMGTLLPGHGGIMDRLDSVLPSAFVTWLVLTLLV